MITNKRKRDKKADDDHNMSFNSSDMEAYRKENPIPVLKQAYNEYQRNKRKAAMRRPANTIELGNSPSSLRKSDMGLFGSNRKV